MCLLYDQHICKVYLLQGKSTKCTAAIPFSAKETIKLIYICPLLLVTRTSLIFIAVVIAALEWSLTPNPSTDHFYKTLIYF